MSIYGTWNVSGDSITLYHVGFYVIEDPDLHYGKKNADFGQGFYLSDDEEFSHRWAKARPNRETYINVYELNRKDLRVKCFERNEEWFRYIFDNRRGSEDSLSEYDIIVGPIANDTIYDVMGITTSGFLTDEQALKLLQVGPSYRQIAIKTQKAKSHLTWLRYEQISEEDLSGYRELVEAEEQKFQLSFSETLSQLLETEE